MSSRALALAAAVQACCGLQDVWILSIQPFTTGLDLGDNLRAVADLMAEQVNTAGRLLPGFRLRLMHQDSRCRPDDAGSLLLENLVKWRYKEQPMPPYVDADGDGQISASEAQNGTRDFTRADLAPGPVAMLGPGCSTVGMRLVPMAHTFRLPVVSGLTTSPKLSDRELFPNFFRTIVHAGFVPRAIVACIASLGLRRFTVIMGDLAIWGSVATVFVAEAEAAGLELVGTDLGSAVPGLKGEVLVNFNSYLAAAEVMLGVRRANVRAVASYITGLGAYHHLLCASHQQGAMGLLWFTKLASIRWTLPGVASLCTPQEILGATAGHIMFNPSAFLDNGEPLTCGAGNMTSMELLFFARLQQPVGKYGKVPLGYRIIPDALAIADAVCMYALALKEMLFARGRSLLELAGRSEEVYGEFLEALGHQSFNGVQGQIQFQGSADHALGGIKAFQLQARASPCLGAQNCTSDQPPEEAGRVYIGLFSARRWQWTEDKDVRLKFHLADEVYPLPLPPRTSLPDFQDCGNGLSYDPALRRCEACSPGRSFVEDLGGCVCARGYAKGQGSSCVPCGPGEFSDQISAASCKPCARGRFAGEEGQSECQPCPVGTYAGAEGSRSCQQCSAGRAKPELWTTMGQITNRDRREWTYVEAAVSFSACGCDKGSRDDGQGDCMPCGEGLLCAGMDAVSVRSGFYSEGNISIYRCHGEPERCIGGAPGMTCNAGRRGIACAECQEGFSEGGGGVCEPCLGADRAPFIAFVVLGVLMLCVWYKIWGNAQRRLVRSTLALACIIAVNQLLTAMQILSVLALIPITWTGPMATLVNVLQLFTFNIQIFRFGCVSSSGPLGRFVIRLGFFVGVCAFVVVAHVATVMLSHRGRFKQRHFALKCTLGSILSAFYITVVTAVLAPLQCEPHPNGKWTIRQYESVICWDSQDHLAMFLSAVVALLLIPLPYMLMCLTATRQFPRRMSTADLVWLKSNSFLFFRFKPDTYWFINVLTARSLLTASVPAMPGTATQIIVLQAVTFGFLCTAVTFKPWRAEISNTVEVVVSSFTLFLCSVTIFFAEVTREELESLAYFCICLLVCGLVPVLLVPLRFLSDWARHRRWKRYQHFLCHHKAGAGAFSRLLKIWLLDTPGAKDVFLDSDNLENLSTLFEFVRYETDVLVVVASREVFTRPWCAGEMTVARLFSVRTLVVALPSAELPTATLIDRYSDLVSGLEALAAENLNTEDVQETLRWIHGRQLLRAQATFEMDAFVELTREICDGLLEKPAQRGSGYARDCSSFILCDVADLEAVAAAHVLQKMLMPHFLQELQALPRPLGEHDSLPEAGSVVVLLSARALDSAFCLELMIKAMNQGARMLPVTLQESYRYPTAGDLEALQERHGPWAVGAVKLALQEISVPFQPQFASHKSLEVGAKEVARRLQQSVEKRSTWARSGTWTSEAKRTLSRGASQKDCAGTGPADGTAAAQESQDKASKADGGETPAEPQAQVRDTI